MVLCPLECWAMEHSQVMSLPGAGSEPPAWEVLLQNNMGLPAKL